MITPEKMADVTNYLFAAQALTPVDGMSAVWADYANMEIPDLAANDLLPAARLCLKKWASEGRSWKVDLPRFVDACRHLRKNRLDAYRLKHGEPSPQGDLTVEDWQAWTAAARAAIMAGDDATPHTVETHAWQVIGRTPPQLEPTTKQHVNTEKIGHSL